MGEELELYDLATKMAKEQGIPHRDAFYLVSQLDNRMAGMQKAMREFFQFVDIASQYGEQLKGKKGGGNGKPDS